MIGLTIAFIALSVFGVGVTIVDIFGALGHADDSSGHDGDHGDGHGADHDAGHDAGHAAIEADSAHGGGHEGTHDGQGIDHGGSHQDPAGEQHLPALSRGSHGSVMAAGNRGVRNVARLASALRTAVYFSLGAGPMGLFASLRGQGIVETILWAVIAGFLIAVVSRTLRRVVRRDLDSSVHDEDLVGETAEVTVPIAEGLLGKARIKKYGREMEVYVRLASGSAAKGELVRLEERREGEYLAAKPGADGLFS
jgi:membrane protein implicated in regulation of membrane protease activity